MTRPDAATEALAEALAILKGHDEAFRWSKILPMGLTYDTYIDDAEFVERSLKRRGYVIRKARKA